MEITMPRLKTTTADRTAAIARSNGKLAAVAAAVLAGATAAHAADDCSKDVAAAFEKQRAMPGYQVSSRQPGSQGEITNTFTFQQPDKMHNKLVSPDQPAPLETIAIGRWAWANQGGGWQELYPQFAQSVTSDVATTLTRPAAVTQVFTCAGQVTHDGKPYIAYRTAAQLALPGKPEGPDNPMLARTVLVDGATGLPSFNLVGRLPADTKTGDTKTGDTKTGDTKTGTKTAEALMTTAYSYPADIKIEAPDAVPSSRSR